MANVYLPTMVVTALATVTYLVDVDAVAARLDLSLSILLAAIALKFATSSYLPQIAYLTIIDKYVIASFCALAFSAAQHALIGWLDGEGWAAERLNVVNRVCLGLNCVLWALMQGFFLLSWRRATRTGTRTRRR